MSTEFDSKHGPPSGQYPQYNQQYPQQPPPPAGYNNPVGYGYSAQNTTVVAQPGYGGHMVVQQPRPSDYLILSIVSCFFCWPMAICALVSSLNSQKSADAGDYPQAMSQGRTARNIAIAAIVIGIVFVVIAVVATVVTQVIVATTVRNSYNSYSG